MQNTETIAELDGAGLRRFAWLTGAIVVVLFGLVLPWLLGRGWPMWPWLMGAALALWGALAPDTMGPVYRLWMRLGQVMHRLVSPLLLGLIFFLIITPTGLVMRIAKRRRISTRFDRELPSYRITSRPLPRKRMEKPF